MPPNEQMTLWTWQGKDFDISKDRVDLDRSGYLNEKTNPTCASALRDKYAAVRKHLKTDQLLWCYTAYPRTTPRDRKWVLNVPVDGILGFVDEWLAYRLCQSQWIPELNDWQALCREAIKEHPGCPHRQEQMMDERLQKYSGQRIPAQGRWESIFVDREQSEHVTALVRCPVEADWVIESPQD